VLNCCQVQVCAATKANLRLVGRHQLVQIIAYKQQRTQRNAQRWHFLLIFLTTRLISVTVIAVHDTIITFLCLHFDGTSSWKPASPSHANCNHTHHVCLRYRVSTQYHPL